MSVVAIFRARLPLVPALLAFALVALSGRTCRAAEVETCDLACLGLDEGCGLGAEFSIEVLVAGKRWTIELATLFVEYVAAKLCVPGCSLVIEANCPECSDEVCAYADEICEASIEAANVLNDVTSIPTELLKFFAAEMATHFCAAGCDVLCAALYGSEAEPDCVNPVSGDGVCSADALLCSKTDFDCCEPYSCSDGFWCEPSGSSWSIGTCKSCEHCGVGCDHIQECAVACDNGQLDLGEVGVDCGGACTDCQEFCPGARDCTAIECGLDPVCGIPCGTCAEGEVCEVNRCVSCGQEAEPCCAAATCDGALACDASGHCGIVAPGSSPGAEQELPSCPSGNGLYCGPEEEGLNPDQLYECLNGSYIPHDDCAGFGCITNPSGVHDACECSNGTCTRSVGEECDSCPEDCCPVPPGHLRPPDGEAFQIGDSILLSWTSVADASRYRVKICTDLELEDCLSCSDAAPGPCEFEEGVLQVLISEELSLGPGTYYWQPQAITQYDDDNGTGWGPGGEVWSFTIGPDTTADTCVDECVESSVDCDATGNVQVCVRDHDEDPCLEWESTMCPGGTTCQQGECVQASPSCVDACPLEAVACMNETTRRDCVQGDACLEFAPTQTCPSGDACVPGQGCTPNPEPGTSNCPTELEPSLPSDAACDLVINFDESTRWYEQDGSVVASTPRTTAITIVDSAFDAQARLDGDFLEVQKTLLGAPPLGNSGVYLYWGGIGVSRKYARVQCSLGDVIECPGTGPVACTGGWQILESESPDNNWSCGLGKRTGSTLIDWVATVSFAGQGSQTCVDSCIEAMVQCTEPDQVQFCGRTGGCLEWLAEQQPCPVGYVCNPGPWGPTTACVQCGGASQPCCEGAACPGGGTCQQDGICSGGDCGADMTRCDGECTPLEGDRLNCGACGYECPEQVNATVSCVAGECTYYCETPYFDCDEDPSNGCESSFLDLETCGSCDNACAGAANADPICDTGVCKLICDDGFDDCTGGAGNGCETSIYTSPDDCGACEAACSLSNALPGCTGGSCTVVGCTGAYDDCDGLPGNGCEADLSLASDHCGACNSPCAIDEKCVDGECVGMSACSPPGMVCDAECVDTSSDANHCGSCSHVCPPGDNCGAGICSSERVVEVGAGMYFSCGLRENGTVACWGLNGVGQLGDGGVEDGYDVAEVVGLSDAVQLSVGLNSACVVRQGGALSCWGDNASGRLGDGTTTSRTSPVNVSSLSNVEEVVMGESHTCARVSGGQLYCWGDNSLGALGNGSASGAVHAPQLVTGVTDATSIAAAYGLTCVAHDAGGVSCWGYNTYGQVGSGETTPQPIPNPTVVSGLTDIVEVAAGGNRVCARANTGTVSCWGENHGPSPVVVSVPGGAEALALGLAHSCAVTPTGAAYCWGGNWVGQVGDGSNVTRSLPTRVQTTEPVTALGAGDQHSCAATIAGAVLCIPCMNPRSSAGARGV